MDTQVRNLLITCNDEINIIDESLQGYAFEDYRTNRKLKIDITNHLEIVLSTLRYLSNHMETERHFDDFKELIQININDEYGISEELIWKIIKFKLRPIRMRIEDILSNHYA